MQVKATGEACGKQEEETAVASRAAKRCSGPAISLAPQSCWGHTGPVLLMVVLTVTSRLSGQQQVDTAQKMLCRRFFPRPGQQRGGVGLQRGGWAEGCPRSGGMAVLRGCSDSQQKYALRSQLVLGSNPISVTY